MFVTNKNSKFSLILFPKMYNKSYFFQVQITMKGANVCTYCRPLYEK